MRKFVPDLGDWPIVYTENYYGTMMLGKNQLHWRCEFYCKKKGHLIHTMEDLGPWHAVACQRAELFLIRHEMLTQG